MNTLLAQLVPLRRTTDRPLSPLCLIILAIRRAMPTFRPREMQGPRITGQGGPWPPLGRGNMYLCLVRRSANRQLINGLSGEIVAAARYPVLYTECAIQDSLDGR